MAEAAQTISISHSKQLEGVFSDNYACTATRYWRALPALILGSACRQSPPHGRTTRHHQAASPADKLQVTNTALSLHTCMGEVRPQQLLQASPIVAAAVQTLLLLAVAAGL